MNALFDHFFEFSHELLIVSNPIPPWEQHAFSLIFICVSSFFGFPILTRFCFGHCCQLLHLHLARSPSPSSCLLCPTYHTKFSRLVADRFHFTAQLPLLHSPIPYIPGILPFAFSFRMHPPRLHTLVHLSFPFPPCDLRTADRRFQATAVRHFSSAALPPQFFQPPFCSLS